MRSLLRLSSSRLLSSSLPSSKMQSSSSRPSSDMAAFREKLFRAKRIVILSGAGISAESGVPTFRGAGGLWRTFAATDLASPVAFRRDPSLVWEFYHYRRELVNTKQPNAAHYACAEFQSRLKASGAEVTIVTQNVDQLHQRAGASNVIELHGALFRTRCTKCFDVAVNTDSPICEALGGKGKPDPDAKEARIPVEHLPRCPKCSGLLRPDIVWFGENLDPTVMAMAQEAVYKCQVCLVVGTSSVVYPAAMFAPEAAARGAVVAEFNTETTPATDDFQFHFEGPCGTTLPKALAPAEE